MLLFLSIYSFIYLFIYFVFTNSVQKVYKLVNDWNFYFSISVMSMAVAIMMNCFVYWNFNRYVLYHLIWYIFVDGKWHWLVDLIRDYFFHRGWYLFLYAFYDVLDNLKDEELDNRLRNISKNFFFLIIISLPRRELVWRQELQPDMAVARFPVRDTESQFWLPAALDNLKWFFGILMRRKHLWIFSEIFVNWIFKMSEIFTHYIFEISKIFVNYFFFNFRNFF